MIRFLLLAVLILSSPTFASEKIKVGDNAPKLQATTDAGTKIDLAKVYTNNKFVVIYFFPKANTPGCTAQSCSLRDSYQILKEKGLEVIGVSVDNVKDLAQFKKDQKLPFTLIADQDKKVIEAFGVDTFLGLAKRQAFLVKEGKVVWIDRAASTKEQAQDILKVLETQK